MKNIKKVAGLSPQGASMGPGLELEFLEPLGLEYILGVAKEKGCDADLFTLYKQSEKETIEKIVNYNPEVLAVSCMTPQYKAGLKMAKEIKERLPNLKVVFGGYHPSFDPHIVNEKSIDFCVRGEGEQTFGELLDYFDKDNFDYDKIKGISYLKNGKVIATEQRSRIQNLDELPLPVRPQFLKELKNYGLTYPAPPDQVGFASLDYSRGCSFACDFCASPNILGRNISWKSKERMVTEIKELHEKDGIHNFYFTDLNFTANKDKVRELCNELVASKIKIYWECMSNIATADDSELLNLMWKAGCRKIGWGVEAVDENSLKQMNKPQNVDMAPRVLKKAEDVGILNTGFYMIGIPSQNSEEILKSSKLLNELPLHRLRVTLYTPIQGSNLYSREKEKLSKDTDLFDTQHLVFKHPSIDDSQMEDLRMKVTKDFYKSNAYQNRARDLIKKFPEYRGSFDEYLSGLDIKIKY